MLISMIMIEMTWEYILNSLNAHICIQKFDDNCVLKSKKDRIQLTGRSTREDLECNNRYRLDEHNWSH
jgi:hypothetical protein